jgi:2-succinyl-5-enolpyruvyl-6-hydroxy-3-cyclohexene-1-carboxylate synthase
VIAAGDWIARRGDLQRQLAPDAVVRFGAPLTSKAFNAWLGDRRDIPQIVVDESGWRDPEASARLVIHGSAASAASGLRGMVAPAPASWMEAWRTIDLRIRLHLDLPFPSEPGVARATAEALPEGAILYVASSMPIRDVDAFFPNVDRRIRIVANRGANGIDGLISSALGSYAGTGKPVFALTGDLSLLHDLTAVATARRLGLPITILLVNNDGGGIFHFLPQAGFPEHFDTTLVMPSGLDFGAVISGFGVEHRLVESHGDLIEALGEGATTPRVIEVRTDRHENEALHRSLWARIAADV